MAHIDLYAPVAHVWYMKSVPSRIGLFLNLPVKKLEQVVYFASYIVTDVYEDKLVETVRELEDKYKVSKAEMQKQMQKEMNELKIKKEAKEIKNKEFKEREAFLLNSLDELTEEFEQMRDLLKTLNV
jgi:DNA-directed RNA polymerase subunit beta'